VQARIVVPDKKERARSDRKGEGYLFDIKEGGWKGREPYK